MRTYRDVFEENYKAVPELRGFDRSQRMILIGSAPRAAERAVPLPEGQIAVLLVIGKGEGVRFPMAMTPLLKPE